MAITEDLRKTLTDPTPLYFAAGTADLAVQQALRIPGFIEQLRAEAPARFEAVRSTDPREVQDRAALRAKEAQSLLQAKVNEVVGAFGSREAADAELKRLGETAQGFALRGVGIAAEYAVRAKEAYEKVAEHGEKTVRTWRGEAAEEIVEVATVVEPDAPAPSAPKVATDPDEAPVTPPAATGTTATDEPAAKPAARKAPAKPAAKPAAKRAVKPAAKPAPGAAGTGDTGTSAE